jgi:methyltransferase (TIGR00027 family)
LRQNAATNVSEPSVKPTNPISRTAFYCTGVRAEDARSPSPIGGGPGDRFAERFMDEDAWRLFARFRRFRMPNASNVVRHLMIDELLRARLQVRPDLRVVLVGAGFDSRAFRLTGGRWFEIDEANLLAFKEARLPADESPNPLQRIAIDFRSEPLAGKLAAITATSAAGTEATVAVVEGVLMYLSEEQICALLSALAAFAPGLELICDVPTPKFIGRFARRLRTRIHDLEATFAPLERPLEGIFAESGFEQRECESIPGRAATLGALPFPGRLAVRFLRSLREGYTIRAFRHGGLAGVG